MPSETLAILLMFIGIPMVILSIPFTLIITHHRRKMEELRLQRQNTLNNDFQAQLNAMRSDIQNLRETAMQYDMSFDAALQRVDSRLASLETDRRIAPPQTNSQSGGHA